MPYAQTDEDRERAAPREDATNRAEHALRQMQRLPARREDDERALYGDMTGVPDLLYRALARITEGVL